MDIAEDALAELDFVIGSVHSYMNLEAAEMTERLLRALECAILRVMGHPTGRILLHREPFPFDFERGGRRSRARGVWLEINASPERLDLGGPQVRAAKARAQVYHQYRRAPSQTFAEYALWRHHGAAGMAGSRAT